MTPTEKAEPTAEKQPSEFSDLGTALTQFEADTAKQDTPSGDEPPKDEAKAEEKETPEKTETKTEPPEKEESTEKEPEAVTGPKTSVFVNEDGLFVDADGNPKPRVQKIDGKDVEFKSLEDYDRSARMGYHHDARGKELNDREAKLQRDLPIVDMIMKAQKEGRLIIKEPGEAATPPDKPETETAIPELDLSNLDPEVGDVIKTMKDTFDGRIKTLEAANKKLTTSNENLQNIYANDLVKKVKGDIEAEIATSLEKYPLAAKADGSPKHAVWDALAEVDQKTDKPVYTNVDDAVKAVHAELEVDLKAHLEKENYVKVDDDKKREIVADYMAKQEESDKAPVSAPGVVTAGTPKKKDEKQFEDLPSALRAFEEDHGATTKKAARF